MNKIGGRRGSAKTISYNFNYLVPGTPMKKSVGTDSPLRKLVPNLINTNPKVGNALEWIHNGRRK
jgi:hypothetical protein